SGGEREHEPGGDPAAAVPPFAGGFDDVAVGRGRWGPARASGDGDHAAGCVPGGGGRRALRHALGGPGPWMTSGAAHPGRYRGGNRVSATRDGGGGGAADAGGCGVWCGGGVAAGVGRGDRRLKSVPGAGAAGRTSTR